MFLVLQLYDIQLFSFKKLSYNFLENFGNEFVFSVNFFYQIYANQSIVELVTL